MLEAEIRESGTDVRTERILSDLRQAGRDATSAAHRGRLGEARQIITTAQDEHPYIRETHPFAAANAYILHHGSGDLDAAHRDLIAALEENGADSDPRTFNEILGILVSNSHVRGNRSWWTEAEEIAKAHEDIVDPVVSFTLDSYAGVTSAKWREGTLDGQRLEDSVREAEPWKNTLLLVAAGNLNWRLGETRFIDRLLLSANPNSSGLASIGAQFAVSRRNTGMWKERRDRGLTVLQAIDGRGLHYLEARLHGFIAVTDAYLGDVEESAEHSAIATAWAAPRGMRLVLDDAWHARAVIALTNSDFETGHAILSQMPTEPHRWSTSGHGAAELLDFADACVALGRPEDAEDAVRVAVAYGIHLQSPRQEIAIRAAEAFIEQNADTAEKLFNAVIKQASQDSTATFDLARVRMGFGRFLHNMRGDIARASTQVLLAIPEFEALGAAGWAARARRELASFKQEQPVTSSHFATLSRQEQNVVALAAQGLSNKEIAVQLFISARTVGYHLYNAFPKLGVTSRAGLRDALSGPERSKMISA